MPAHGEVVSWSKRKAGPQITPPSVEIIGEGAAVFMDMTETILDVLDKQVNLLASSQPAKRSFPKENQKEKFQKENHRFPPKRKIILICFCQ